MLHDDHEASLVASAFWIYWFSNIHLPVSPQRRTGSLLKLEISQRSHPTARSGTSRLVAEQDVSHDSIARKRSRTALHDHGPSDSGRDSMPSAANAETLNTAPSPAQDVFERYSIDFDDTTSVITPLSTTVDATTDAYWYALSHVGAIFRIDKYLYVTQDWNIESEMLQVCG